MTRLSARDATALLDIAAELAQAESAVELKQSTARLMASVVPCMRSGWVEIDTSTGRLTGTHWPEPVPHLLGLLPTDLQVVPLIDPLTADGSRPLRISDCFSREQWHSMPIYAELYGPNGCEHQVATKVIRRGTVMHSLSVFRPDLDFTAREVAILHEVNRHAAIHGARLVRQEELARWLTPRQLEVLTVMRRGLTVRQAAAVLDSSPKTVENHLQAAYRRLGVHSLAGALWLMGDRRDR